MSRPTTVRLEDSEVRALEDIARRKGTTISALIQTAVRAFYLRRKGKGGIKRLLQYIDRHPHPTDLDPDALDRRIQDAMRDAADR